MTGNLEAEVIDLLAHERLIGGDDLYEHFLAHATVNANGVVTVDDFSDDMRCR